MKVTAISVSYERKLNTGDYSSATIGASTWADLEEGDDPEACRQALFDDLKASVRKNAAPLLKARTEQLNEVIAGLPPELAAAVKTSIHGGNGHGN